MTKKDIKIVIFLIAFGYAVINYHSFFPKKLPDYERVNSFSLTIGDYHNVKLNYVVHKRLDDKNLYKEIEAEHNRMEGKPTELEINLYASMDEWENGGDAYMEVFFDYENNTSRITRKNIYKKPQKNKKHRLLSKRLKGKGLKAMLLYPLDLPIALPYYIKRLWESFQSLHLC